MKKVIYKYTLNVTGFQEIEVHSDYKILHVDTQYGEPRLWILVDPESPKIKLKFQTYGTGHPVDIDETNSSVIHNYIGTYLIDNGNLVFHVFQIIKV